MAFSYFVGQAVGTGVRRMANNAAQRARIQRALSLADAVPLTPVLDIDREITEGHYIRLGVPWGFRDLTPDEVSAIAALVGTPVILGVTAKRTDLDSAYFAVHPVPGHPDELIDLLVAPDQFQQIRVDRAPSGRPVGQPYKIRIAGEVGLLFHFSYDLPGVQRGQPDQPIVPITVTEMYFRHGPQLFFAEFSANAMQHERYLPVLWTLLGSWQWLR